MRRQKQSEFSLIDRLKKHFPRYSNDVITGIGDDCAVIRQNPDSYLLATCDVQVDGIHFTSENFSPSQIGQKALAVNISDIAAMGGTPSFCLISLILTEKTAQNFLDDLYAGIARISNAYGIQVVGGNISQGKQFAIDIFLLGSVKPDKLLLRSGAKPYDKVMVTGTLGNAAAGLALLHNSRIAISSGIRKKLIAVQVTPTPRLKESEIIAGLKGVTAMIDISDGLASDILHLCDQSNSGVEIWESELPITKDAAQAAKLLGKNPTEVALSGGEDYELLFTASPEDADIISKAVKEQTGTPVTIIGEILPETEGKWVRLKNGERKPLEPGGWDHLK